MIQLIKGDCLDLLPTLPAKSIDCFLCDLPYGCLAGATGSKGKWDNKLDLEQLWTQIKRMAKSDTTPVLFFCTVKYGNEIINSNPKWFRYDIVWKKTVPCGHLLSTKMPMRIHETILVFSKKGSFYNRIDEVVEGKEGYKVSPTKDVVRETIYGKNPYTPTAREDGTRCSTSVVEFPVVRNTHPTAKPIDLYKWLLKRYCPEGGTVLDPTAGSFNSLQACKEMGINAIGIEMNEEFYDSAKKRLADEVIVHF